METKSWAVSKRLSKRLQDEQDELEKAFEMDLSALRLTLWKQKIKEAPHK